MSTVFSLKQKEKQTPAGDSRLRPTDGLASLQHLKHLHHLGLLPREALPASVRADRATAFDPQLSSSSTLSQTSSNTSHRGCRPKPSGHRYSLGQLREAPRSTKPKRHLGYATVDRVWQPPPYSPQAQTSFDWRSGHPMAGMLEMERTRTRRERTFIGSECAVCEEPLEHTLRGERILQFSCGHVCHEACFYEYIKELESQYCPTCNAPLGLDTSRGGNVLDLEKLSAIVRSIGVGNESRAEESRQGPQNPPPAAWESQAPRERPRSRESTARSAANRDSHDSRESYPRRGSQQDARDPQQRERIERYSSSARSHARNGSNSTAQTSSQGDYAEAGHRRHDYDLQAMETDLSSPRASMARNPIPAPVITIRSEYPTLTRSKQSQTLTCLVTVEVPEGKWKPTPEDLRPAPPLPSVHQQQQQQHRNRNHHEEKEVVAPSRAPMEETQADRERESPEELEDITEDLRARVENWHGLDFSRFGRLGRHGTLRVSRDRSSWQELECFLFAEMLICIKEKRGAAPLYADGNSKRKLTKCTLRGSILIKKHLRKVESQPDEPVLSLGLAVQELSEFHLQFQSRSQLEQWKRALLHLIAPRSAPGPATSQPAAQPWRPARASEPEPEHSGTDDEEYLALKHGRVPSSVQTSSSWGAARSVNTAPTEYTYPAVEHRLPAGVHVPLDLVVVVPVSSSMQGLKISLLRDALRFLVQNLGERDRMGLVTFGSSGGGVPLVGMTSKTWPGWTKVLGSIRPVGQKSLRADVVEGANVAMDLLMQRKTNNPIAAILLISDSSTSDADSVDFVVSRAEAAKITIHSFGLGLTHKPDTMMELSNRTKASYTYVKDWMILRDCIAGCLGSLQTTSHQNAKLRLRLPEGSPAKFAKISGALQVTKRTGGREAEASLGDLRFGDKRDILVQLVIPPDDSSSEEHPPQDHWESIVSGLEALGGSPDEGEQRTTSIEEVPLIQADLAYGDILREGTLASTRPSLLAITMLSAGNRRASRAAARPVTPPIPPHPSIVQRRMELLTSDMLARALYLVSRGQHERASHLLTETRSILKGLSKGGLPPIPPPPTPRLNGPAGDGFGGPPHPSSSGTPERQPSPSRTAETSGIEAATLGALDTELEASLEWMSHPAVFGRDSRKSVLQAIGVIGTQRGYTFRTPAESLWAGRVAGVRSLTARSREWREVGEGEALTEEAESR